ncbi:MAG: HAD family phosphatase [Candidatus Woesearchaeota archaeon]
MIKAIIFDLDGVLVDSVGLHYEAWRIVLARYGIRLSQREFNRLNGYSVEETALIRKKQFKLKVPVVDIIRQKKTLNMTLLRKARLFTGARPKLKEISKSYILGLATSSNRADAFLLIRRFMLDKFFSTVVVDEDVERAKPVPDIFLECARRLKVAPNECVVIEDSKKGIEAAKKAGMKCIAIASTFKKAELSKADVVIPDIRKLTKKIISRLEGKNGPRKNI